jgi:hydrogenase maturation protease
VKILIAGIGNMFLGDDGFGSAVAQRLCTHAWPSHVSVIDYGIRGMDHAFALTSGIDAAILVDAYARGGAPGTLYKVEPAAGNAPPEIQTHAMDPASVLALAATLGTPPRHLRLVGCEPASLGDEDGDIAVGLSPPVEAAIDPAVVMVRELVAELEAACTS